MSADEEIVLTGSNNDGGGLVVDGHRPVVGGDGQPAPHLVQAPVHHGAVLVWVVVGINFDALGDTVSNGNLCQCTSKCHNCFLLLVFRFLPESWFHGQQQLITSQEHSLHLYN